MNPLIFTYANRPARKLADMLESAKRFGYPVQVLGSGEKWIGLTQKLHVLNDLLNSSSFRDSGVTHIGFVDGYDAVFVKPFEEFVEEWQSLNHPLIFSAERPCSPCDRWKGKSIYEDSPYPYLNSGGWFGERKAVVDLFADLRVPRLPLEENDQGFISEFCYQNPGRILLDHDAVLFQSLVLSVGDVEYGPKIKNVLTNTFPSVIHANGGVSLEEALLWLRTN